MRSMLVLSALLLAPLTSEAQQQPPSSPPASPAPSPSGDDDARKDDFARAEQEWAPGRPSQIDLGLWLGFGHRLDEPALFPAKRRQGVLAGLGADVFFSRYLSLGLRYEHLELGSEESGITKNGVATVERRLDAGWLNARLYPIRLEGFGAFLRLAVGMSWQAAVLGGTVWIPETPDESVQLRCSARGSVNAALGAEIGVDAELGAGDEPSGEEPRSGDEPSGEEPRSGARFLGGLGFDSYRLSSDMLDDCVPGAGSAVVFGLRAGFAYGIGL